MKPVVIIAIAVLFLIPINVLAYEPSQWEKDTCREWVDRGILYDSYNKCIADAIKDGEERERPRQMLYAGVGIVILIVAIGIIVGKVKSSTNQPQPIQAEIVDVKVVEEPKGFDGKITEDDLQNNFSRLSWENAEDLVGKLFEEKGYSVIVSQRSADFGIDVHAENGSEKLGIQVKHWNHQVGFENVAKTLGVAQKFNKVIIVNTKNGFTPQAWQHANNNPYLIELWDSNRFKQELRQYVIGK